MGLIDLSGISSLIEQVEHFDKDLLAAQSRVGEATDDGVAKTARLLREDVVSRIILGLDNTDTDRETKSLTDWEVSGTPDGDYVVYTNAPHARAFEYGSGTHGGGGKYKIEGSPKLIFYWDKVGEVVEFEEVKHPGVESHHFLAKSVSKFKEEDRLSSNISDELQDLLEEHF